MWGTWIHVDQTHAREEHDVRPMEERPIVSPKTVRLSVADPMNAALRLVKGQSVKKMSATATLTAQLTNIVVMDVNPMSALRERVDAKRMRSSNAIQMAVVKPCDSRVRDQT